MSYVSPIKIGYAAEPEEGWTDKIGKYMAGEVDNLVMQSCVKVGCHVDKDELEKALRYDRGQYEKGYEDGKHDAVVRCKDCDNWSTEFSSGRKSLGNYRCLCQEWSDAEDHRFTYTGENEYCSRGERREE